MNNLIRSLLALLFLVGILFCHTDEPQKKAWEGDKRTSVLQQVSNERAVFGLGQKRMLRLKQSANDDRTL